ncbi:MAG TPA: amidase family protein [Steroidobacteraceae bacterium]|nr:amidase family protein [Steroidobacteraceae bacterium]
MPSRTDLERLAALDAHDQAAAVASGECAPEELIFAAIERIERWNPCVNAVTERNFERALERARALDRSRPFAGVPLLLKDSTEYPEMGWSCGSRAFARRRGQRRPAFVCRLEDAGLIVIGKTNMPEGGLLPSTEGLRFGAARNPWNRAVSAGGSSGGAAAAVSCGMAPLAQASDGGGSIRIPAASCGVFGLKPSRGRVARARDEHWLEDLLVGDMMLTRSVRDAAAMLAIVTETSAHTSAARQFVAGPCPRRLVIGVNLRNLRGEQPDARVAAAIDAAVRLCRELGHEVREFDWPFDCAPALDHFIVIWRRLAHEFATTAAMAAGELEPWTLGLAAAHERGDPEALARALDYVAHLPAAYDHAFSSVDVVMSPVAKSPTPALGVHAPTRPFAELLEAVFDYVSYTPLHNLAGAPAMSIPLGLDACGLPQSVMLAARCGDEATLLQLAHELASDVAPADRYVSVPPSSSMDVL